jgi:hypothetical protein
LSARPLRASFTEIARACGYTEAWREDLAEKKGQLRAARGPAMLEIMVRKGARADRKPHQSKTKRPLQSSCRSDAGRVLPILSGSPICVGDALLRKLGGSELSAAQRHECCRKATPLDHPQLASVGPTSFTKQIRFGASVCPALGHRCKLATTLRR